MGLQNIPTAYLQGVRLTQHSEAESPVVQELWGMQSTPLFPSLPWPEVVASDKVLIMGQVELNRVLMLNWIVWNRSVFT